MMAAGLIVAVGLAVLFRALPGELELDRVRPRWRWTGPAIFLVCCGGLAAAMLAVGLTKAVRVGEVQLSAPQRGAVAAAVGLALLGAALRRELLFRLLLQTRL
jgi:membrane protease YdiL (CAAX protease family)